MTDSLAGLRVWITRPAPGAEESVVAWRAAGAHAEAIPLVRLERFTPGAPVRARLGMVEDGRWVFTSANAVRFLHDLLEEFPDGQRLARFPALAVGRKTAQVAGELGFSVTATSTRATGADLANEMVPLLKNVTALVPGSDRRRPEVQQLLEGQGVAVVSFTVYCTWPVTRLSPEAEAALARGDVHAVALYSPSAVEGWTQCVRAIRIASPALPPALVLGPTTAAAARSAEVIVAAEAEDPGEEGLLQAASVWWAERGQKDSSA